jgi:phosphoserine phosphatase RsbU/P
MSSEAGKLRDLQIVTDAALGRLGVDQLLGELLERVREIAQADTVAALLLDERSQMLIARAACGIEDEVREGFRVPVGVGFAGRIALQKRPVLLEQVDADNGRQSRSCGKGASGSCSAYPCSPGSA